ncbi:MAG: ComF family protein [Woeseiaceae bacterium]
MNPLALLRAFDDAVMPVRCVFCGTRVRAGEGIVCSDCFEDLPWRYSAPAPVRSPLEHEIAPLAYEFPVDAAIKLLKFRRRLYYGPALAQLACAALDDLPAGIDAVLPVPLHWRRQWLRGFNQAHEIAKPVAKWLGVPLIRDVRRRRATAPQSGLSARGRTDNLRNAFDARRGIARRHVLIIDDVMTTGTTVRQLGRAVLAAGAASVSALAVARAGP